jgi:MtN3 and saliva related transmembrane protein
MTYVDLIGSCAAVMTTISFMPQAIKVIRTNDTRSLSLIMYLVFTTGVAFWLIYGILKKDLPITISNIITIIFAGTILVAKIRNLKRDRDESAV